MPRILLVDDFPSLLLDQLNHLFVARGWQIDVARSGAEGLECAATSAPDVVLLDVSLPDLPGLEVHRRLREQDARLPVIFITATSTTDTAIEAMRHGAYDYLFKPVDLRQLEKVLVEAMEVGRRMRVRTTVGDAPLSDGDGTEAIVGRCAAMLEVYKAIGRVADQRVTVLITGESGTGKDLVARSIYQHGARAKAPFLAINCAAIPENLLESELFGHERGAFTGADRRRIGKFEQCNGGTIFLDEVGDMPLATQGKILRLLQDQTFQRVGGNETIRTDVRVIAATNRDLKSHVKSGQFRSDLYFRLSVFVITVPPLRDRQTDLPTLVQYYLRRYNRELGREIETIAPDAMHNLRSQTWPGNIRELQSVLKQALLLAHGTELMLEFLPEHFKDQPAEAKSGTPAEGSLVSFIDDRLRSGTTALHSEAHLELDRLLLARTLRFTGGNQLHAAKVLGIARQTLRNRLHELNISVVKSVDRPNDVLN